MFVIVCVAMDMLAFGLFIPVMPDYLVEITGKPAEDTVMIGGILMATFGIMNFITMPIIGNLSDRFGRRPVLLVSIAGLCIDFIIMGFAHSLVVLFLGRALAGVTSATYSTANSYIADVTEPEDRGRAFGMIGAAFGIGFVIGPVVGGILGDIDTRLPFFVAAGIAALNFLYGLLVLPESLGEESRRPFNILRANPFGAFMHFSKLPKVSWFIVGVGIFGLSHSVFPATWSWHGEIRYDWSPNQIGLSLAFVGIGSAVVQAGLSGRMTKMLGPTRTAMIGLGFTTLGMFMFSGAIYGWMAYAVLIFASLGGVAGPATQQLMTGVTPKNAQGELQGALASVQSLTQTIIGPLLMTGTLSYFSQPDAPVHFKGANFFLAGILAALAFIPFMAGVRANREEVQHIDEDARHADDEVETEPPVEQTAT
ncbi:MAG: tetracycline resistance MFS efflux pump [Ponticaulis sp.]|nr:tetracycline resistance MFS efflux pump [Ponticaulis sp.]